MLKKRKNVIAWKITDIKGISPSYCSHKINLEKGAKPVVQTKEDWIQTCNK